jgi:SAM-dependent methyltransferase
VTTTHDPAIRRISHQSTNDSVFAIVKPLLEANVRLLDVGAGGGYFSQVVGEHVRARLGVEPSTIVHACDVTPEIFAYAPVRCAPIAADGRLPYGDATFDIVCSIEVVEHVEDQFAFCRELMRVLKPGGVAVITTPNILNLNSRWRYLHSGFFTLFNPLSLSTVDVVHTSGHIHPVGYYYLAYALTRAGAATVRVSFDRTKRSAVGLLVLLSPVLIVAHLLFRRMLRRRNADILGQNVRILDDVRGVRMLTSRSVVVSAERARANTTPAPPVSA